MQYNYIKEFLDLKDKFLKIDNISSVGNTKEVDISYIKQSHFCPKCNNNTSYVHDYRIRKVKHGYLNGYFINLIYKRRRYVCKKCNCRFPEHNSFVEKYNKISKLNKTTILNNLRFNSSFKDIASRSNVSSNAVIRIMDKHINYDHLPLPSVISFDEFKKTNKGKGKYAFNIVDPVNKKIIDIIDDRRSYNLNSYFSKYSLESRKKVKFVIIDLWYPYKTIIKRYFPNALIIVDKFHYMRYIFWAFNDVRIRTMNSYKKNSLEYKVLKKHWKSLIKAPQNLNYSYKFNKWFNSYVSEASISDFAANINDSMHEAMIVKDFFFSRLNCFDNIDPDKFIEDFIDILRTCKTSEFKEIKKTFINWKEEIINSFKYKYTNGPIEGINNFIKTVKRVGYGYTKFDRFKNKIMYLFNKDYLIKG